jgi:aminopeptidase N
MTFSLTFLLHEFLKPNEGAISMKDWIDPWLTQAGFPLITATVRAQGGNTVVDFEQKRFLNLVIDESEDSA